MDVDVIAEEENPMLHRTDVTFELVHEDATPSRLQVRDSLAAKLNKDADEVVVRKLETKFGMRKTVGFAKVYETAAFAADVEADHMLERNKITDDGADAAEPEAEPAEQAEQAEADADADAEAEADDEAEAEADDEAGADADAEADAEAEEA